jgi:cytochrome P450
MDDDSAVRSLPRASLPDTLRVVRDVLAPMVAQGVIRRRPRAVRIATRLHADRRAVSRLRWIRDRYGDRPVLLRGPFRQVAVVLAPDDVRRILDGTPEPFDAATPEKTAALSHFQPHGVLVSTGEARTERHRLNEAALDTHREVHRHGERITAVAHEEADVLPSATTSWDGFNRAWWRFVRRVVLGDRARDDETTTDLLARLRSDANWAGLHPRRDRVLAEFRRRLDDYLETAEPDCLAGILARTPSAAGTDPAGQVPHWMFAFDAAGIVTWKALAVLAGRPDDLARVRDGDVAFTRACVLEVVRLWPTTLIVLRSSTLPTEWDGRTARAGTDFVIVSSAFHRDPELVPYADRFEPAAWLDGRADADRAVFPFSAGPAQCPGRNVVLHSTAAVITRLATTRRLHDRQAFRPDAPMPDAFDHTSLLLDLRHRQRVTA